MDQSAAYLPKALGDMGSSRLWVAMMPRPKIAAQRTGSRTNKAIKIMESPKIKITSPWAKGNKEVQAKPKTVKLIKISHNPRVQRNRETSETDLRPTAIERNVPAPAREKKAGAQKCVIQWVKN